MSIPSLLTILAGILLFGGGLVMLARVVRPWRGGDQVLLVFLAVVISVLGLAIGWLGITLGTESTETAAPQPTVMPQPTAVPPQPTSTAPPVTPRPTVPPPQVTPLPTLVVTAPRPTTPPPATPAPAPAATATANPYDTLLAQARSYAEQADAATSAADKLRHLRNAEVIARSLLASNPCEYTLQALFIRICRQLSVLDPAAAACANAPACSSG